jgi:hypothetical protein
VRLKLGLAKRRRLHIRTVPGLVDPLVRVVRAFSRGPQFAPLLRELGWEARVNGRERLPAVYAALKRRTTRTRMSTPLVELL